MIEKNKIDLIYISLTEKFDEYECPICRRLSEIEKNEIYSILYENVNNDSIRKRLRESLGLCPYYSWMMINIAEEDPFLGGLGPAIIYEDVLKHF